MRYKQSNRYKDWYNCCTADRIKRDPEALYIRNFQAADLSGVLRCLQSCRYSHESTHNGYINAKDFALLPYIGRFGRGWIMVTHLTSYKVKFRYYILSKKEVNEHGKTN